jgi:hypothetical protein
MVDIRISRYFTSLIFDVATGARSKGLGAPRPSRARHRKSVIARVANVKCRQPTPGDPTVILLLGQILLACNGSAVVPGDIDPVPVPPGDLDRDGWTEADGDCDDYDPDIHPEASEIAYNRVDDDCDPDTPDDDLDRDGFGWRDDCDDQNAAVHPGAEEICNGLDDDCDGVVDGAAALDATTWYLDQDGDGHGDPDSAVDGCSPGPEWTELDGDCDDGDARVNPSATEICGDGLDNDCDGTWGDCGLWGDIPMTNAQGWITSTEIAKIEGRPTVLGGTDWTLDGVPDILLSAELEGENPTLFLFAGPLTGEREVDTADGSILATEPGTGIPLPEGSYLAAFDTAGDPNQDGIADLIVSFRDDDPFTVVVPGPILGTITFADVLFELAATDAQGWGNSTEVAGIGDLNGDLVDDVAVAFSYYSGEAAIDGIGAVVLVSGSLRGLHSEDNGFARIVGHVEDGHAGSAMTAADMDGDGLQDLLVSAANSNIKVDPGNIYLLLGPVTGEVELEHDADAQYRGEAYDGYTGRELDILGDMDGDGLPDLVIGAPYDSVSVDPGAGAAYIVYGTNLGVHTLPTPSGAKLTGAEFAGWAGLSVAGPGDVDGDGHHDVLVGAPLMDVPGVGQDAGAAYLVYGPVTGTVSLTVGDLARFTGQVAYGEAGVTVRAAGDMDQDGFPDLLIGASDGVNSTTDGYQAMVSLFSGAEGI